MEPEDLRNAYNVLNNSDLSLQLSAEFCATAFLHFFKENQKLERKVKRLEKKLKEDKWYLKIYIVI